MPCIAAAAPAPAAGLATAAAPTPEPPACHGFFDLHEASQQRAVPAGGGTLAVRYWPGSADSAVHALPPDVGAMLAAAMPNECTQGPGGEAGMQQFEAASNFRVVAVVAVDNALRAGLQQLLRVTFGLTARSDVCTVYHGTRSEHIASIVRSGLRGAACQRAAAGRGVYTSRDLWEAVAYSPPDRHHLQYVLRCDLVCGPTAQGAADQVDFGADACGAAVLTATCPAQRVLVPLHDAQLVVRDIIVVQHLSSTPSWAQLAAVRFYNRWQLWAMVHSPAADNVLSNNKTRLLGELRVPVMVVTARSPDAPEFCFGSGPHADQKRVDGARKHAQSMQRQADTHVQQAGAAAEYANTLEARQYAAAGAAFLHAAATAAAPPWCPPRCAGGVEHRASSGGFALNEQVRIRALVRPEEVGLFGDTSHFAEVAGTIRQISKPPDGPLAFFLEMHSPADLEAVLVYNSKVLAVRGRVPFHNFNHLAVSAAEICKSATPCQRKKRKTH